MRAKNYGKCLRIAPTKCCSNNFYVILSAFIATCLLGYCGCEAAAATVLKVQQAPHECGSLDIRDECSNLKLLENCTVIKGHLMITMISKSIEACNWDDMTFPLLREITDFLILHEVKGLKNIRNMFPSLTVIRGRRLFLDYAVGITNMPDLEAVEFRSLVAVQRGHVFVGSSPKLCQLERINWDRLTLTMGQNHIYPVAPETCPDKAMCMGCDNAYCWSNRVCQKFENDNVIYRLRDPLTCDENCLGGCNQTSTDCAVCRGLTDHGVCVKECPSDKLYHEHSQRCYTQDECINEMGLLRHQNECVSHCPSGYKSNVNRTCTLCSQDETCLNVCQPEPFTGNFIGIYSLSDADEIAGCDIINSTLFIRIENKIDETDLLRTLGSIREIRGYLKIFRSPHLTSLNFLRNLEKIGGTPSESGHYSLVIYGNNNLRELWGPKSHFKLERGGLNIQLNKKLCNYKIMEFRQRVFHDNDKDSIFLSDQEVFCGPTKITLDVKALSHRQLLFTWPKEQTYKKIEIIYRPVLQIDSFTDETELDASVCGTINWSHVLISHDEINDNGTHFSYAIDGLNQNTKYACLVKTFGKSYTNTARSDLVFITTMVDIPPPPKIEVLKKTNVSLIIQPDSNDHASGNFKIDYYLLEVYEKPDDMHFLDKRNFCQNPAYLTKYILTDVYSNSAYAEGYDDCCARLEKSLEDERFMADIEAKFSCSLDRKDHCAEENEAAGAQLSVRLPSEYQFELENLKPFRLYVLFLKACNVNGCSSFSMHSERTNYSRNADMVGELDGCQMPNSTEYRVFFTEPKNPNGAIVSFVVYLRQFIPGTDNYRSHVSCVTRLEHENANNVFVRHFNAIYDQVAVRAHSLAGDIMTNWRKITPCDVNSKAFKNSTVES